MKKFFYRVIGKFLKLLDNVFPQKFNDLITSVFRSTRETFYPSIVSNEKLQNFKEQEKHVFFGYYDITPFSFDDKMLLAQHAPLIDRSPTARDEIHIGFYYIKDRKKEFIRIGKTNTWCWQQGCRLQWYPADSSSSIIYNCMINNNYGAIIQDVDKQKILKEIERPLYSVSSDGNWGLSLDFSRLQRIRPGYGYGVIPDKSSGEYCPSDTGIELVDLKKYKTTLLFSLKDISKLDPHDSMENAEHYFNHIMFNPSGNRFLFFHLWQDKKRHSRLFTCDRDGGNIRLLNNSGFVSHYNWISDNEIILYSYIISKGDYTYAIFNDSDGTIKYLGKGVPMRDGHPTILEKQSILITDTYPDLYSQHNLFAYYIDRDDLKTIARFDSTKHFKGEFRCDLHPRINHNKNMICVDRVINNRRCITLIPICFN
jgi:hypothetical protein